MQAFQKATKEKLKLRATVEGLSGAGKTMTSLKMATALGGRIAVIDTERGRSRLYSDGFDFDVAELTNFSPRDFIDAIQMAGAAGYDVLVIDSLSAEWAGRGGALEMVDKEAAKAKSGNTYMAWGAVTPLHQQVFEEINSSPCHVIATLRSKSAYDIQDRNGKKVPVKIGLAPVQRDGVDFEFDLNFFVDLKTHALEVTKTRCSRVEGATADDGDPSRIIKTLIDWMSEGADPVPASAPPKPAPAAPAKAQASKPKAAKAQASQSSNGENATDKQLQWLKAMSYTRADELGYPGDDACAASIRKAALATLGMTSPKEIHKSGVDAMAAAIAEVLVGEDGHALPIEREAF